MGGARASAQASQKPAICTPLVGLLEGAERGAKERERGANATHGGDVEVERRVLLGGHALVRVPDALGEDGGTRVGEDLLLRRALGQEVAVAQVVDLDVLDEAAGFREWADQCGFSSAQKETRGTNPACEICAALRPPVPERTRMSNDSQAHLAVAVTLALVTCTHGARGTRACTAGRGRRGRMAGGSGAAVLRRETRGDGGCFGGRVEQSVQYCLRLGCVLGARRGRRGERGDVRRA